MEQNQIFPKSQDSAPKVSAVNISPHKGELRFWEWEGDGLVAAGSVIGYNLSVVAGVEVQLVLQLVLVEVDSWYDFLHK